MRQKNKTKRRSPKTVLRLPDLDHSKSSVLQTLGSAASQKTYAFAIDDFISWYLNYAQVHLGPLGNLFYNSKDAELRAPRTASQESPKWWMMQIRVNAARP